jgi:predicted dienelactone hydrolase
MKGTIIINFLLLFTLNLKSELSLFPAPSDPGKFRVGFMIIDLPDDSSPGKSITVAAWYPTIDKTRQYNYGGAAWGDVSLNGRPLTSEGKFPLMVFSHGFGGCGTGSAFFAEALASYGWIVVCPDHNDEYSFYRLRSGKVDGVDRMGALRAAQELTSSTPADRYKYLYRPDELRSTLNEIIRSETFKEVIDTTRIAVSGHSFGGFTALALCGTIPGYYDRRIKALLLFSSGAASYLFTSEELRKVRIPSMVFMGSRERNQKRGERTMGDLCQMLYSSVSGTKYFLEVRGASHFSFDNSLSEGFLSKSFGGKPEEFNVINKYSISFLQKYIMNVPAAGNVLSKKDPMLSRYLYQ